MNIVDNRIPGNSDRSRLMGEYKVKSGEESCLTNGCKPGMDLNAAEIHSLFEHFSWLYSFCREYLFHDHTDQIAAELWSSNSPPAGSRVLELGCGPGFYSCRLAEIFSQLHITGLDISEEQVRRARLRASVRKLKNCWFEKGDVLNLSWHANQFDALIASRLFTVVANRERAISEMYRILRPGGRCFFAEPKSAFRGGIPLRAMWALAWLRGLASNRMSIYREPREASILMSEDFVSLVHSQRWRVIRHWHDKRYQYAVCEKPSPRLVINELNSPCGSKLPG